MSSPLVFTTRPSIGILLFFYLHVLLILVLVVLVLAGVILYISSSCFPIEKLAEVTVVVAVLLGIKKVVVVVVVAIKKVKQRIVASQEGDVYPATRQIKSCAEWTPTASFRQY